MTGAIGRRTIQIHLNRRCNLSCAHCYSRSGPGERDMLGLGEVRELLNDAKEQGYEIAAFSGGEPFIYPWFADALRHARDVGLSPIAVTNGTVVGGEQKRALELLDFLAVSVDGPAAIHNAVRQSDSAFERMLRGVAEIRSTGVAFGFAHTVTRKSLPHLSWVGQFAAEQGAAAVQLHPLGLVGAAQENFEPLDGEALARLYLAALALRRQYGEGLSVHVDLFNLDLLRTKPDLVVPDLPKKGETFLLSEIINPLVVTAAGDVHPICHDVAARYRFGSLKQKKLRDIARESFGVMTAWSNFCRLQLDRLLGAQDRWPYVNWYEWLERAAGDRSILLRDPRATVARSAHRVDTLGSAPAAVTQGRLPCSSAC